MALMLSIQSFDVYPISLLCDLCGWIMQYKL